MSNKSRQAHEQWVREKAAKGWTDELTADGFARREAIIWLALEAGWRPNDPTKTHLAPDMVCPKPKKPETKLDAVKCGNCGCDTANLFVEHGQARGGPVNRLVLKCTECGDVTNVTPTPAALEIEGDEDSKGSFCWGWRS